MTRARGPTAPGSTRRGTDFRPGSAAQAEACGWLSAALPGVLRLVGHLALGASWLVSGAALGQLRIATWNVTNYNGGRIADIRTAAYGGYQGRSLSPDAIIAQEFLSAAAVAAFTGALNTAAGSPGDWVAAPFVNGPDSDSAFFYRASKLTLLGYTVVAIGGPFPNHPRNIMRYDVRPVGYTAAGATLACYASHMKSGDGTQEQQQRLLEAERIRDDAESLPPDWHFLLGADLNIPRSTQAAYEELVASQPNNDGRFFDPINTPGNWQNSIELRFVHTQDPIGAGGMDDRFDQILLAETLIDGDGFDYVGDPAQAYSLTTWADPNHSYRAWGNDGTSFNLPLTIVGNEMVGEAIAQAIVNVALNGGHVPVFLDLRVPPEIASDPLIDFGRVPQGALAEKALAVWNDGSVALWGAAGIAELRYALAASAGFIAPGGWFFDPPGGAANQHVITMETSALGPKNGTLTIASNAPDEPSRLVALVGEVLRLGDLNCDGVLNAFDIDPFVLALTGTPPGYPEYYAQFPNCNHMLADCNQDGQLGAFDIDPFVDLLTP